ncbi:DUF4199 domain-containing protein [Flavitalea sp.]|nr:DUF4199 domain-containing protein [Flavitalea sp.]
MKKVLIRYGLSSAVFIVLFFLVNWLVFGSEANDYEGQEVIGYSGIILSMLFVFAGIRYYRDKVNHGRLNFVKALKVGALIALFPSIGFALVDLLYILFINPDFLDQYYLAELEKMQKTLSASEFQVKAKAIEAEKNMFANPVISALVMFLTAFMVGIIVTVISGLILKRNRNNIHEVQPAGRAAGI